MSLFRYSFVRKIWLPLTVIGLLLISSLPAKGQEFLYQFDDNELSLKYQNTLGNDAFKLVLSPYLAQTVPGEIHLDLSEFYGQWQKGNLTFDIGRKITTYGPGRYGFPMLGPVGGEMAWGYLGGEPGLSAEGYDQIGYSFKMDKLLWFKDLRYHKFYAYVPENDFRMLLGQRTEMDWGKLTFAFSETALVNQDAPGFYYLPIPFIPVYFYQYLAQEVYEMEDVNTAGNMAVDFDITWRLLDNAKIYFKYYIDDRPWPKAKDDFAMPDWDEWPWKVGYQLGCEWRNAFRDPQLTLYLEYTRIDKYTYSSTHPYDEESGLDWIYDGHDLGDPLGPDADRINLELVWEMSPEWQWSFAYIREQHGEGEFGDHWVHEPGETEFFLTGVVETSQTLRVGLTRSFTGWCLGLNLGLVWVDNDGNIRGENEFQTELGVYGRFKF